MSANSLSLLSVMTILTVGAAEVESHKSVLAQATKEAEVSKAAADKAELEVERTAHEQHEVPGARSNRSSRMILCESLEQKSLEQASELTKALESVKEARVEAQVVRQEIKEARQKAASKAFLMQSKFTRDISC